MLFAVEMRLVVCLLRWLVVGCILEVDMLAVAQILVLFAWVLSVVGISMVVIVRVGQNLEQ